MTVAGVVERRIDELWKKQRQRAGSAQNWDWYERRVSCTCPPSTSFIMRGGWTYNAPSTFLEGVRYFIPDKLLDITDTTITYPDYTFTNVGWYLPVSINYSAFGPDDDYLELHGNGSAHYYYGGGLQEFETTTEAEQDLDANLNIGQGGYPLCRMVLRNNGNTTAPNQYMVIDPINRGRSYLYGQEIRKIYRI